MVKFYRCEVCGKMVELLNDVSSCPTKCCGEAMVEVVPNTKDAAMEKHVPFIEELDNKVVVKVGEVEHPMSEEHYIEWVYLLTDRGIQRKKLEPNQKPIVEFALLDHEIVLEAYAYCNLHGLWKAISD